jgi:hypothetical protein
VKGGRIVGRGGVQYDGRLYRLASTDKQLAYFGERVDVRINPDDVRSAIILDFKTGAYVCDAIADDVDATYDVRDEITRERMVRVKRDERELKRSAAAHVEGAKERLVQHRTTLLRYHRKRQVQRQAAMVNGPEAARDNVTVFVPALSAVVRDAEATRSTSVGEMVSETASELPAICIVSRPRQRRGKKKLNIKRRQKGAFSWAMIAAQLGVAPQSLTRYRNGQSPWPDGMQAKFEQLAALRGTPAATASVTVATRPPRGYGRGARSWQAIARELGVSYNSLVRYRNGKSPWPAGMEERFHSLAAART